MRAVLMSAAVVMGLAGCQGGAATSAAKYDAESADVTAAPKYEQIVDWLSETNGDVDGWFTAQRSLETSFDNICGDTFCSGDYNPIRPLTLTCSVKLSGGTIGSCLWTFAGAYDTVAKSSGNITNHNRIWKCALPLNGMTPAAFISLINSSADPVRAQLPSGGTLYDTLGTCLSGT